MADVTRETAGAAPGTTYGFEAVWTDRPPRLYLDPGSVNAAQLMSGFPVDFVSSGTEADLLWIRRNPRTWYGALRPLQALNHVPGHRAMVLKADLAAHLRRYGSAHPDASFSHTDFFPRTYCLGSREETLAFVRQLPAEDSRDNLWILKPSNLSEGRGIKIVWQFDWLRKELPAHGGITFMYAGNKEEYVIQRYVKNVLLLDGRKSQLRIYWLIASLDPLLVLIYPQGTARVALKPFKLDDFGNPLVHITNNYQQKQHGGEDALDAELKWDFARLQEYLSRNKGVPGDFVERALTEKLKQILAYVVRASIDSLRKTPPDGLFFGLYGADFLLDEALTPWLTEIQRAPGLQYDDAASQRVVPPMLRGAVSIVLEALGKKRRGDPLTPLSDLQGYQWVIRDG